MTVEALGVAEQAARLFLIVYDLGDEDGPEKLVTAGHGIEFPDGSVVFVWSRKGDGRRGYGEFDSVERALAVVGMLHPVYLIGCD